MRLISIPVAGILCALAGCDLPLVDQHIMAVAPTAYHTVAYYDSHPLERRQADAWCTNNPGLATKIPSCDSADVSSINAWHHEMGWK